MQPLLAKIRALTAELKGAPVGHEFYGNQYTDAKISSPEFKAWFGKSKVVDKDGKPLVVYKAMYPYDWRQETPDSPGPEITSIDRGSEFPTFNDALGPDADEPGVRIAGFFGTRGTANNFASGIGRAAVFPVFLSLQNPFIIDAKGAMAGTTQFGKSGKSFRDAIRSGKYDGVIIQNTADEGDVYVALEPTQIKSAISNSTFDPKNPDFTKAAPDGHPFYGNQYTDGEIPEDVGAKLAELRKLTKRQLEEIDPYDDKTGATYKAMVLLDAEQKLPKADGGWRSLPPESRLGYMAHALVNVGGKPYLASKYDDPDDISDAEDEDGNPAKYVWNFSTVADQLYARSENSFTGNFQNKEDAVAEFREHLAKKREAKATSKRRNPAAPSILKARAFDRERVRKSKLDLRSAQETPLQRAVASEIARVGKLAAKAARMNRLQKELGNLREEHTAKVREILHKAHGVSARTAWDNQFLLLRGRLGKARMQSFLDRTLDFLDEQSGEKIVGISDTTLGGIQNALTYGEENEYTLDEISDFITSITGGLIGGARAATIARTEVGFATSTAEQNAIEDSGVPCMRFWMSTEDGVTRPSHLAADGQRRGMQEPFLVGGEYLDYPNDPNGSAGNVINCRCVVDYQPV